MSAMVDDLCQKFATAWAQAERPQLADFVADLPDKDRSSALRQLIEIDVLERKGAGQNPVAADYAAWLQDDAALRAWFDRFQEEAAGLATCVSTYTERERGDDGRREASDVPGLIGRYRTQRLLGVGAFGMVLAAWDQDLDRPVAVKVPLYPSAHDHVERQLAEARAAAKLSHHGIVGVHDCGRLPDGRFYIVSEYVEGGTLNDELKHGRPTIARAVHLVIELAEAAHHAHLHGLFHRDLKPSNILIEPSGQPRITDFGLALDEDQQYLAAGEIAGSPAYMSPEQVQGQSHYLDGRSDLWSLGVIFYELLTGRRPFRAPTVPALREEILRREPRPPRQIDDAIPLEVERCCLKCLQKPLADRYASGADLAADLRHWLSLHPAAHVGTAAAGLSSDEAPGSLSSDRAPVALVQPGVVEHRVRRLSVTAAGLCVATLLLFGGWRLWGKGGTADEPIPQQAGARDPEKLPATITRPVGAGQASALLGPTTVPVGEWLPLLDQQPRVLHWPLVPKNSELNYREATREISINCDQSAIVEFGRTAARDFQLRVRIHQPTWTGGVGVFWGYRETPDERNFQYQAIVFQPYRVTQNAAPLKLQWVKASCNREGWPVSNNELQTFATPPPGPGDIDLDLVVRNGLLQQVKCNGKDVGDIVCRDPAVTPVPADSVGAFGLTVQRSAALVREAAIRFLE